MPSPDITIGRGALSASFRPEAGGRMSRLVHRDFGEILVPMTDETFDPYQWPKAGAYPLFPFHNRVCGGIVRHGGRAYRLSPHPALSPDAMHGPAHRRAWQVAAREDDRLVMALDYAADADWPFAFRAEQMFALDDRSLTIRLRLTNRDDRAMPGGMGWHPYFASSLDREAHTDARAAYPLDAVSLPVGNAPERRNPGTLPDHAGYTIHLCDWTMATARLDGGGSVTLRATAGLPHLAVHRMPDYLCLEPVSHRAGAFATGDRDIDDTDIAILAAGQTIEATIRLEIADA